MPNLSVAIPVGHLVLTQRPEVRRKRPLLNDLIDGVENFCLFTIIGCEVIGGALQEDQWEKRSTNPCCDSIHKLYQLNAFSPQMDAN
jgi:hypothetical protein